MASHVARGDVRVTDASSLTGRTGEVELVVRHATDEGEDPTDHRFVYRYEYDEVGTPEGFTHSGTFVSWRSAGDAIHLETFLPLSHVEQYLHHHGVEVGPTLAPGMYPMVEATGDDTFEQDIGLDVEVPEDDDRPAADPD